MLKPLIVFVAATALGATIEPARPPAPLGAAISAEGYATITSAPPAPFIGAEPLAPKPLTAEQIAAHEQFRRAGEFQNRVREEVQALASKLRRAEKGNFIDLYYENEGDPHVVFRFLRDGPRTLARYTKNPSFVAATGRYTNAELKAALDFMMNTFLPDRVIAGAGYGNKQNRAEIDINVTEAEFQALAATKGVKIPDAVQLHFTAMRPASVINRPLPPEIAPLVRVFPRDDRPIGMLNSILSRAKVVLRDGCFRSPDQDNALVLFPLGAQLFIDDAGYLAFGEEEAPGYARVGEEVVFPGSIAEVTAPELLRPIHAACGPGKVIKVNGMRSAAADRAQGAVTDNANTLRQLQQMYGLSDPLARKALDACKKRSGFGNCLLTPPSPVARQVDCPAGTKLSSGLCRTPGGFVRPLPKWIAELAGAD